MRKKRKKHLEYDQIERYIYIGTTICCQYHFKKLLKLDIVADIDLEKEKMDKPSGVKSFLWLPTIDFTPPSQIQLDIGVNFIDNLVRNKMRCYVHCNAGHGRAPTLVAAYYIFSRGLTPSQAIRRIKKKRNKAHPNKKQVAALSRYAKRVSKKRK